MSYGTTAAIALSVVGGSASTGGTEQDLETDAAGDLLTVDSAGDTLLVSAGFVWLGGSAAAGVTLPGATAMLIVPERLEQLEAEGWTGLSTESGSAISTEGA